ncbi:MAG: ABC transporter permease [Pseudomonadota bacterium]
MKSIQQIVAVTLMNLRSLSQRLGSSFVIVIGMAGVVAVLISILAMATGAENAMGKTGRPDRAIVIHAGALSELLSNLPRQAALAIGDAPGLAKAKNGEAVLSAESIVLVEMKQKSGLSSNVSVRGVGSRHLLLRPEVKLVEGRAFQPGLRELMAGKSAQAIYGGLAVGSQTMLNGQAWTVVGVFESNGDARESEVLADNETLMAAFHRDTFQSVSVQLRSAESFAEFRDFLTSNPQLSVSVARETDYYAEQSKPFASTLSFVAYLVGGIMAVGAFFGAINSMYSAVSVRTVEIATLRAIGFRSTPIVVSIFIESLLLALLGAALGAALAALVYSGHTINTNGGGVARSQYLFAMTVTSGQVQLAMIWACVVGIAGALPPALRAARMPVVAALRGG